ncbi:MAG: FAD-dependent oxidoreductase, partial [Chloroflexota bacterium]
MSSPPPLVRLFEPGKIGAMELKNRLIMAPMMSNQAHDGYISDEQIAYYAERAKGGVGMVTCGAARASYSTWNRRSIAIYDDKFIPGLRRLTEAIHAGGAKACIQLNQLGVFLSYRRRAGIDTPDTPEELDVMGPSHVPWVRTGYTPREATKEDIQREVAFLVAGSRRAKEAGFDAVEFHGAHGYLIGAFLSPFYNRRIDEYGGTTEKRARFACEILRATRQAVGPDFPLIFRMNGSDCMEGGITIEESRRQAPLLVAAGADALHVSASSHETTQWQFLPYLLPDGAIVYLAEAIKKVVTVPVITVGKLGDPVLAEKVLAQHQADFIAWGRPLLADPALPSKVKEGRLDDINRCICCNLGCISRDYAKFPSISCVVNPATGREQEFAIRPARRRKQVMVVGGGLAGMEAARVMAERGHQVTLYE